MSLTNISLKILYLVITCNLTHLQDRNTKVNFILKIVENFMLDPKTYEKLDPDPKTIIPDPQYCCYCSQ